MTYFIGYIWLNTFHNRFDTRYLMIQLEKFFLQWKVPACRRIRFYSSTGGLSITHGVKTTDISLTLPLMKIRLRADQRASKLPICFTCTLHLTCNIYDVTHTRDIPFRQLKRKRIAWINIYWINLATTWNIFGGGERVGWLREARDWSSRLSFTEISKIFLESPFRFNLAGWSDADRSSRPTESSVRSRPFFFLFFCAFASSLPDLLSTSAFLSRYKEARASLIIMIARHRILSVPLICRRLAWSPDI